MKKLIALLLTLTMITGVSMALATGSITTDDTVATVSEELLEKVEETESAAALLKALEEAKDNISSVFPEDLAVADNAVVQELISVRLNPEYEVVEGADAAQTIAITADVSGAKEVRVLIAVLPAEGEELVWYEAKDVQIGEDGATLTVTFSAEEIASFENAAAITLIVLTVPAE